MRFLPGKSTASFVSLTSQQGVGELNWSGVTLSQRSTSVILDLVPEKSNVANKEYVLFSRTSTCDLTQDPWVIDQQGNASKVISITKNELVLTNDIKASCACSYKAISVIDDLGAILYWGQQSVADLLPPTGVKFVCVRAGYYGFVGVSDDGKLYVWGESAVTLQLLKTNVPTGNDFIDADIGMNYGVALKADGTLVQWGTTSSYVLPSQIPSGKFKKITCGYKVACALREDGVLVTFGTEDSSLIATTPTYNDIKDFDLHHQVGIYIRQDGSFGKWGTGSGSTYAIPTSTVGKKMVKARSGRNAFSVIDENGIMYTWGYSSMITSVTNPVQGVTDTANDQYFGVYITTDGSINLYNQLSTSDPVKSIVANKPSSTVRAIMSGTYLAGYEYTMKLDKSVVFDDMHFVSGHLYYNSTDLSPKTKDKFLPATKKDVNFTSNGIEVTYELVELNTTKLTLFYEVNNSDESVYYIDANLQKFKIGE